MPPERSGRPKPDRQCIRCVRHDNSEGLRRYKGRQAHWSADRSAAVNVVGTCRDWLGGKAIMGKQTVGLEARLEASQPHARRRRERRCTASARSRGLA